MLEALRKGSGNIIVKTLLLVVVLSFIIWGVGDMFRGRVGSTVAEVGHASVSLKEYDSILRREIQRIQTMSGGAVTSEQIMAMQVDRMVLNQLINARLVDLEARSLGLRVGKDLVQEQVVKDPSFKDAEGNFDKNRFLSLLRANDFSESTFVDLVKKGMVADFLVDALTATPIRLSAVANALYAFRNETRKIDLLTLTAENVPLDSLPGATDAELLEYYNKHKDMFSVPEYRAVSYVTLKTDDVTSTMAIDEGELQKIYDAHKAEYQVPERRAVDNILFDSEEKAKEAWDRLNKQEDFYAVAEALTGAEKADIELGLIKKEDLLKDTADVVFSLQSNSYSAPVKGAFGWYIFRVREIVPAKEQSFEEVRDQIASQVKSEGVGDVLQQRINDIEDAFASGSTLAEVAKTYHLSVNTVGAISKEGKDPSGVVVSSIPDAKTFLNLAFNTSQGEISPLTITSDNSAYVAVQVDTIVDPRVKALDEVKAVAQEAWKKEKQMVELKKLADKLSEDLQKGRTWQDATSDLKVKIETGKTIGRLQEAGTLMPEGLQEEVFKKPLGGHTSAYLYDGASYMVALVREVIPAKVDKVKLNIIKQGIISNSANDLLGQYNAYLRGRYPVTVNEQLLKRAGQ